MQELFCFATNSQKHSVATTALVAAAATEASGEAAALASCGKR